MSGPAFEGVLPVRQRPTTYSVDIYYDDDSLAQPPIASFNFSLIETSSYFGIDFTKPVNRTWAEQIGGIPFEVSASQDEKANFAAALVAGLGVAALLVLFAVFFVCRRCCSCCKFDIRAADFLHPFLEETTSDGKVRTFYQLTNFGGALSIATAVAIPVVLAGIVFGGVVV